MKNKFWFFHLLTFASLFTTSGKAWADAWKFAVISDIHINTKSLTDSRFTQLVARLVELHPKIVIVVGDTTNGNRNDRYRLASVRSWWAEASRQLEPLQKAGIIVLPVAGNHDYYRDVHRQAYTEAAKRILAANPGELMLNGQPPLYYSTDVEGTHLSLLHIVDQRVGKPVANWLTQDLSSAKGAALKFAFGHVPLSSVISKPNSHFIRDFGQLLVAGSVTAYFAGHEHLVWDQALDIGGRSLRQVMVGTASGTYNFELSRESYVAHCSGQQCVLPFTKAAFSLLPGTRQQHDKVTFMMVEVSGETYDVQPFTLAADGTIVPFGAQK